MTSQPHPDASPDTPRHPIAVIAERTGLSQDLLRMWERRYGAVRPTRGPGGQRLYSDADLERLRLIDAALGAGRRIGSVARLPTSELAALVAEDAAALPRAAGELAARNDAAASDVERAIELIRALDPRALEELLRRSAAVLGVPTFLDAVAAPLLERVGDDWHADRLSIAEEHLASAVIGDVVGEVMRTLARDGGAPRLLVATPAGSRHVLGAALVGATAAAERWDVVFLGADLPAGEIAAAARRSAADAVALSVVYAEDVSRTLGELRRLRETLPAGVALLVGGRAAGAISPELSASGIDVGDSLADLRRALRRLAPTRARPAASRAR